MRAFALALALCGCATAQVALTPAESTDLLRELNGQQRFLRVSMNVTPFYGDATRKLLTPLEPSLVRFLNDTSGKPINPGAVEATFPAGTPVRIEKVEFPTGWTMAERVLYTPRTLVWVYVEVDGRPRNAPPAVLVLRPGLTTKDDFMVELEHHLTREDQAARLDGFSDAVREAIKKKQAVREMPATALEMAWGYPESKRIELVDTRRRETWSWGDGARKAVLLDGRVQEVSGAELH